MWNFLYGESLTVYYLKEPDLPRDEWERMGNGAITPVEWCAHCSLPPFPCLPLCGAGASAAFVFVRVTGYHVDLTNPLCRAQGRRPR